MQLRDYTTGGFDRGQPLWFEALWFAVNGRPSLHELLIVLFLFLTAPVSAHLLVQAALRLDPSLRPPPPGADPH